MIVPFTTVKLSSAFIIEPELIDVEGGWLTVMVIGSLLHKSVVLLRVTTKVSYVNVANCPASHCEGDWPAVEEHVFA